MTDTKQENFDQNNSASTAGDNKPDWIVKAPRGQHRNSNLERIGAAWSRDDGGIGIRLYGKQIIEDDIYLYPNEPLQQ